MLKMMVVFFIILAIVAAGCVKFFGDMDDETSESFVNFISKYVGIFLLAMLVVVSIIVMF